MAYIYFVLAGICFLSAAVLEINRRRKHGKGVKSGIHLGIAHKKYYDIEYREEKTEKETLERRNMDAGASGGKFDHLFRIKPEEAPQKIEGREEILKEAELMPEIPKIGTEDKFEPLYFRVGDGAQDEQTKREDWQTSREPTRENTAQDAGEKPQPKDWLFFDPNTLETKNEDNEEEKTEKKDNSWTPAFFFGDDS
jgi:hypothetical protein